MDPIIWAEGAYLSQQHFQYWDAWLLAQQQRWISLTSPEAYGLVRCQFEHDAFSQQKCVISSIVWRTEQGQWIVHEGPQTPTLSVALEDVDEQWVYLNVPKNTWCHGLSGYEGVGEQAAYEAQYVNLNDIYDPQRKHEVTVGRLRLRLTTQPLDNHLHDSWPVVKIKKLVDRHFEIDQNFIPQSVTVSASISLQAVLQRVLTDLSDKTLKLQDQMMRTKEPSIKTLFSVVSEGLFDLKSLAQCGSAHPRELHHCLTKLLMRLGLAHGEIIQPQYYQHEDMGPILMSVIQALKQMLTQHVKTLPSYTMALSNTPYPSLENISQEYLQGYSWYLGVDFSQCSPETIMRFSAQAKMGTVNTLEKMLASALPGIPLTHLIRAPKEFRSQEGFEYFKIGHESPDWRPVKEERSLMIYLPPSLEGRKITLDIVKD